MRNILDIELDVVQRHIDSVLKAEWFRLADSTEALETSYGLLPVYLDFAMMVMTKPRAIPINK